MVNNHCDYYCDHYLKIVGKDHHVQQETTSVGVNHPSWLHGFNHASWCKILSALAVSKARVTAMLVCQSRWWLDLTMCKRFEPQESLSYPAAPGDQINAVVDSSCVCPSQGTFKDVARPLTKMYSSGTMISSRPLIQSGSMRENHGEYGYFSLKLWINHCELCAVAHTASPVYGCVRVRLSFFPLSLSKCRRIWWASLRKVELNKQHHSHFTLYKASDTSMLHLRDLHKMH